MRFYCIFEILEDENLHPGYSVCVFFTFMAVGRKSVKNRCDMIVFHAGGC